MLNIKEVHGRDVHADNPLFVIKTSSLPNNKKEVLFHITPLGKEIFQIHRDLHEELNKGAIQFLKKYDENELRFLTRALRDASVTSWITLEPNQTEDP